MNFLHDEISIDDDFVSSEWIYSIVNYASVMDLEADKLFKQVGINPGMAADRDDVITVRQLDALIEVLRIAPSASQALSQIPKLISELMLTAVDVRTAFHKMFLYKNLIHPLAHFTIEENLDSDETLFRMQVPSNSEMASKPIYFEMFSNMILDMAAILVGKSLKVKTVSSKALGIKVIEKSGLERLYSQNENVICFDGHFLNKPVFGSLPEYHEKIERKVKQKIAEWPKRASYKNRVLELLDEQMGEDEVDMDFVCEMMGVNRRTLQRKLKLEGVRFQELLDSVRFRHAKSLLKVSAMDIVEISSQLGYSEPSAFYQAFKRWSGLSPGDYRSTQKHV